MKRTLFLGPTLLLMAYSLQAFPPETSTFDGKIGKSRIILVANPADSMQMSGFYVENRGKAVETPHTFSLVLSPGKRTFQSDLYSGRVKKAQVSSSEVEGKLVLYNARKKFLFFRPRVPITLQRRPLPDLAPSERYRNEIFPGVGIRKDISYGQAKGYWTSSPYASEPYIDVLRKGLIKTFKDQQPLDLKLDLYYPETDTFTNRPLVMLIHGGAFYVGSKEAVTEKVLATNLAKRGYVVASIDYRLGFKPTGSDVEMSGYRAIQDAHAALRYLSNHSGELGINPKQVYVGGTSAGAIASLNVAFMDDDERPASILKSEKDGLTGKIASSGNRLTDPFEIKAVVNMWGAVNDVKIIDRDEKIPVLSIHGTADNIVPYDYDHPFKGSLGINRLIMDKMYGSKPIHDWLQALGIRNRLITLPGAEHEPELSEDRSLNHYMDTLNNRITRFLYEETAPEIIVLPEQLVIAENSPLKPIPFLVRNGNVAWIEPEGGVKASANPADATVIWIKDREKKKISFITNNSFGAFNTITFPVTIGK